ncbi:hypothetical protein ACPWSR_02815 [Alloiococcus sp. CFN-8]|uniref:hypothetical protein n=1 Tax=Alloiococcus sp. CFN-8 TaxID=3416081 RepID=UPI003CF9AE43
MMNDMDFILEDTILVRCLITSISGEHYKGKDYQGNRYYIEKNEFSKTFQVGDDRSFYAYKKEFQGIFEKRTFLFPLSGEDYLKLIDRDDYSGKTLKEAGITLRDI